MQLNVLDDLTEAMKALDGSSPWVMTRSVSCCRGVSTFFAQVAGFHLNDCIGYFTHTWFCADFTVASSSNQYAPRLLQQNRLQTACSNGPNSRKAPILALRAAQDNEALLVTQVIKFGFSWINFSNTALLGVQKANVFAQK